MTTNAKCDMPDCKGLGVIGNGQIVCKVVMCDFCHADYLAEIDRRKREKEEHPFFYYVVDRPEQPVSDSRFSAGRFDCVRRSSKQAGLWVIRSLHLHPEFDETPYDYALVKEYFGVGF